MSKENPDDIPRYYSPTEKRIYQAGWNARGEVIDEQIAKDMDEYAKGEIYGMLEWLLTPSDDYTISSGKFCFYFNGERKTFPQMYELYLQHKLK